MKSQSVEGAVDPPNNLLAFGFHSSVGVIMTPRLRAAEAYGSAWPSIITLERVVRSSRSSHRL